MKFNDLFYFTCMNRILSLLKPIDIESETARTKYLLRDMKIEKTVVESVSFQFANFIVQITSRAFQTSSLRQTSLNVRLINKIFED